MQSLLYLVIHIWWTYMEMGPNNYVSHLASPCHCLESSGITTLAPDCFLPPPYRLLGLLGRLVRLVSRAAKDALGLVKPAGGVLLGLLGPALNLQVEREGVSTPEGEEKTCETSDQGQLPCSYIRRLCSGQEPWVNVCSRTGEPFPAVACKSREPSCALPSGGLQVP